MIFETGFEVCVVFHKMGSPVQRREVGVRWGEKSGHGHHGVGVRGGWEKGTPSESGALLFTCAERGAAGSEVGMRLKPAPEGLCKLCLGHFPSCGPWAALEGVISSRAIW